MTCINLAISSFSLLAAIASAIAAWKSAASAKFANTLVKESLTKRAQSDGFLKVLVELSRIYRLLNDFISKDITDFEFETVLNGKAAVNLLTLLKELEALSPQLRASLKEDAALIDLLKRMSAKNFVASSDDLNILQNLINLLQTCQRKELSSP